LSSAEAELIAMVKLSTELLGLMNLARDLNCRLHGRVWADSSAALAVVKRQGAGKLRHINISLLWVQEQEKLKKLYYEKVPGQDNPADLFTKGVGREKLQQFAWASSQVFLDGRAEAGLQVQGADLAAVAIGSVSSGACRTAKILENFPDWVLRTTPPSINSTKVQHKFKNSELARVNIKKLCCLTIVNNPRSIRTIGETQMSYLNVDPNCYENPRRSSRGGADDNMFESGHAQFLDSAGEDINGGTYNYTDISTTGVSSIGNYCNRWNELKGYVPRLAPAQMKIYRNIGVWRYKQDVRLSVHAQSEKNRNIGVRSSWQNACERLYKQIERWGQFKLRNPPNANLQPEEVSRRSWMSRPRRSCGNGASISHVWPSMGPMTIDCTRIPSVSSGSKLLRK